MLLGALSSAFGSTPKEKVTPAFEQTAVMIWDAGCITKVEVGRKTYIEAPMKDGAPVMDEAVIFGVLADYKVDCGHVEIRKEGKKKEEEK